MQLSPEQIEQLTEKLADLLLGEKLPLDIVQAETGERLVPANHKINKTQLRTVARNWESIDIDPSPIRRKVQEVLEKFRATLPKEELVDNT